MTRVRKTAGVLVLCALLGLCLGGRRIHGPTSGVIEAADGTPLENLAVRMRCGGNAIHGGHTTDSETTVVASGERFRFWWAWGGISPIGCSLQVHHPAYVTAYVSLDDRFSQDVGTIRLQSWQEFLAAGPTDPPAHSAYPWPVLEIQQHLSDLQYYWLPAHGESAPRELARYIPALRDLFHAAILRAPTGWHAASHWNMNLRGRLSSLADATGWAPAPEETALFEAASAGDTGAVAALLADGAPTDAWDPRGFAPLHLATRAGHAAAVEALLDGGADIDRQQLGAGNTALLDAIDKKNDEIALRLIARGADLTLASWRGAPLMRAARYSVSPPVYAALLARGVVAATPRDEAVRVLHVAARSGRSEVVEALLAAGTPPDALEGPPGYTALMGAAHHDKDRIARLLIDAGADVNARTDDGKTALSIAREQESPRVTALLLEAGAGD